MPETYSNGKHNAHKNADTPPWCSLNLDWPFETVIVETETVTSREPNPFEWAVVRILQEFEDKPPSLAEAAEELGIKDPVFLTETLKSLLKSGAIEKGDPEGNLEFSNCRLTATGHAFLTRQQLSSLPERHGMELYFDIMTGEHITRPPRGRRKEPKNPVIPVDTLPDRRTNIGLDTARQLAKAQDEPFLTAQSKLTGVNVQHEQGSIAWRTYEIRLSIDVNGAISCLIQGGTESQQQWLDQLDLRHELIERLLLSSIGQTYLQLLASAKQHDPWRQSVDRPISPSHVAEDARATLKSARQQIMAHVYWLSLPEVRNELLRAADRGIHCTLFGQSPQTDEDLDSLPESIEVIQTPESPGMHNEIAILVDEFKGLVIDRVELTSPSKRTTEVIVASSLKAARVIELHHELHA